MEILSCGHELVREEGSLGAGYGTDWETGKKICYACCGRKDEETMMREGRITLYLSQYSEKEWQALRSLSSDVPSDLRWKITNWPGTLTITPINVRRSWGSGWGRRYPIDMAYFTGPDGYFWFGRCAGNSTQLLHCQRARTQDTFWAKKHWEVTQGVTQ